jgi:hypothetical protein
MANQIRKSEIHIEFLWNKKLMMKPSAVGRLTLTIEDGENSIAVIQRTKPARQDTYDTGEYEEVYFEFLPKPAINEVKEANDVLAAALYQYGSSVLIYQSNYFTGKISVMKYDPGIKISAFCDLLFSRPAFDRVKTNTVPLKIDF